MIKKRCECCGRLFETYDKRIKTCSRECKAELMGRVRAQSAATVCKYNERVGCADRVCGGCGWNPEVEKMRIRRLRE